MKRSFLAMCCGLLVGCQLIPEGELSDSGDPVDTSVPLSVEDPSACLDPLQVCQSLFFVEDAEFVIPSGVHRLFIQAWGGGGGAGASDRSVDASGVSGTKGGSGGDGAYVETTVAVVPLGSYQITIGRGGGLEGGNGCFSGGDGAAVTLSSLPWAGPEGGGGGGATCFASLNDLSNPVLVAGGGGGGGGAYFQIFEPVGANGGVGGGDLQGSTGADGLFNQVGLDNYCRDEDFQAAAGGWSGADGGAGGAAGSLAGTVEAGHNAVNERGGDGGAGGGPDGTSSSGGGGGGGGGLVGGGGGGGGVCTYALKAQISGGGGGGQGQSLPDPIERLSAGCGNECGEGGVPDSGDVSGQQGRLVLWYLPVE